GDALPDPRRQVADPDAPLIRAEDLDAVERSWAEAGRHTLAAGDRDYRIFEAAVRIVRWLAGESAPGHSLPRALDRHVREDAWVDEALTIVHRGVDDPDCADALRRVLAVADVRRRAHDRGFAAMLASAGATD